MKKTKLYFNETEWRIVIRALNDLRTKCIHQNRDTSFIDEVIFKTINAPMKRIRIV